MNNCFDCLHNKTYTLHGKSISYCSQGYWEGGPKDIKDKSKEDPWKNCEDKLTKNPKK